VGHHDGAIFRHGDVKLKRIDSYGHGFSKPEQRVLGKQAARTTMTVQFDFALHRNRLSAFLRHRQDGANAAA
jgi:hypothetical protein